MTIDIKFGIIQEDEEGVYCDWPGLEKADDGTSETYTIFSGKPQRSFPVGNFSDWVDRISEAAILDTALTRPEVNGLIIAHLDDTLMLLINLLPEVGWPQDVDRARWFKHWARRAKEEFGDQAVITVSV